MGSSVTFPHYFPPEFNILWGKGWQCLTTLQVPYDPAIPLQLPPLKNWGSQAHPPSHTVRDSHRYTHQRLWQPALCQQWEAAARLLQSRTSRQEAPEHFFFFSLTTCPWRFCHLTNSVVYWINLSIFDQGQNIRRAPNCSGMYEILEEKRNKML